MDGRQGASQAGGGPQFGQSQIGAFGQQLLEAPAVAVQNLGFASGKPVARSEVAGLAALLEAFLDHAQGNPEAVGDLLAGTLPGVVNTQDAFPKIHG